MDNKWGQLYTLKPLRRNHILIIYSLVPNPAATACGVKLGLIWGQKILGKQARELATYNWRGVNFKDFFLWTLVAFVLGSCPMLSSCMCVFLPWIKESCKKSVPGIAYLRSLFTCHMILCGASSIMCGIGKEDGKVWTIKPMAVCKWNACMLLVVFNLWCVPF